MKRVAWVFSSAPHGSAAGREGLDALLATSALSEELGVFFIGDGVLQLLADQNPQAILARNYIPAFKLMALYDIERCWVCAASLRERGLEEAERIIDAEIVAADALRALLDDYDVILRF